MAPPPPELPDSLLSDLLRDLALGQPARRDVLWEWWLSRVERVHLTGGESVVVKVGLPPMEREARILGHLRGLLPVPTLMVDRQLPAGGVVMAMEDLGPASREATCDEAATAACLLHCALPPAALPLLGEQELASLPDRTLAHVELLRRSERWDSWDVMLHLLELARPLAKRRAADATIPPFGLCHSEFHPTSLHIGRSGWRLLDWARAFRGPGLLDLASWQGTSAAASPEACRSLIEAYVAAGGPPEAEADRAGLPAERWALGWHRLWIVEWFVHQAAGWHLDPDEDRQYQDAVHRHLAEALDLLGA